MMIQILIALLALASLAVLFSAPPKRPPGPGLGLIIAWNTLIPLRVSDQALAVIVVSATIAIAVGVRIRVGAPTTRLSPLTIFPVLFVLYMWVRGIPGSSMQYLSLQFGVLVALLLMLPLGAAIDRTNAHMVARYLAVLVVFHGTYAVLEQDGLQAVWPLGDGTYDIRLRPNELLPFLPGRSMTSFSHPIPLSLFFSVALIYLLFQVIRDKRRLFILPALIAIVGLGASGTRSTVVALLAAGAATIILNLRIRNWVAQISAIALVIVLAFNEQIMRALGLGVDFTASASYQHRYGVLSSVPNILRRPPSDLFFGSGTNSAVDVLTSGLIRGVPGLNFFDNQFVAALVLWGTFGVVLLAIALLIAFVRVRAERRIVLVYLVAMFFAFDALTWLLPSILLFATLGIARRRTTLDESVELADAPLRPESAAARPISHVKARDTNGPKNLRGRQG